MIMKRWHRSNTCLNCDTGLSTEVNFCPKCGQKNTISTLSIREILADIFDIVFNLNTRVAKSIIPFLFKPGTLTKEFIAGKRVKYVHPARLYLFMSILFFFVFSLVNSFDDLKIDQDDLSLPIADFKQKRDSVISNMDQLLKEAAAGNTLDSQEVQKIQREIEKLQIKEKLDTLNKNSGKYTLSFLTDTLSVDWNKLNNVWAKDPKMTPELLLDSTGVEDKNFFNLLIAKQLLKYAKNHNTSDILNTVIDNVPIMIILLLPIYALYLKLLYVRRKRFYIEHLVFAIHIHAFTFFIGTTTLAVYHWLEQENILFFSAFITLLYAYFMFKRVYQQHWFKTWLKMFIIGSCYLLTIFFASSLEILISLLTF